MTLFGDDDWPQFTPPVSCRVVGCHQAPVAGSAWCGPHTLARRRREEPTAADARRERDDGMARVEAAADDDWLAAANEWLQDYLRRNEFYFADDAWAAGCPQPRELRAFGPLVLKAARAGWIVKTGRYRPRTHGHLAEGPVWRSMLYEEEA